MRAVQTFSITGEVRDPGTYVWHPTLTLVDAVTLAGGLAAHGTLRGASARRGWRVVPLGRADVVLPDDQLAIRRRLF